MSPPFSKRVQPRPEDLAKAHQKGRTSGLREALMLLGLGIGLGVASALKPRRCDKCSTCRLDAGHKEACSP